MEQAGQLWVTIIRLLMKKGIGARQQDTGQQRTTMVPARIHCRVLLSRVILGEEVWGEITVTSEPTWWLCRHCSKDRSCWLGWGRMTGGWWGWGTAASGEGRHHGRLGWPQPHQDWSWSGSGTLLVSCKYLSEIKAKHQNVLDLLDEWVSAQRVELSAERSGVPVAPPSGADGWA